MKKYDSRSIKDKWLKTKWLLNDSKLRPYVPETKLFSKTNLEDMVSHHRVVYFKPTDGTGGFHIIRIDQPNTGGYRTQHNKVKKTYSTLKSLYSKLKRFSKGRSYLLQQGINLAETNGHPFDIRVMIQKTSKGKWVATALFTKIGKLGKVVNNYHQGGRVGFFRNTMKEAGYGTDAVQQTEEKLKELGVSVGSCFDQRKKGFRELGLDVALDQKGGMWILEVNTRPQFYPLKAMKNTRLYKKIVNYAKQYGRYR